MNGGHRERKREETRTRIFEQAMRLFSQRGYNDTPVEEITAAADVAKGTFFNYFPTKEAILEVLAERQLGVVTAAAEASENAASVRAVLNEMVHKIAERPARSQLLARSLLGTALGNNTVSNFLGRVLDKSRGHVAQIMARGQQLGEIRSDIDPLELARLFQHAIMGTQVVWALSKPSDLNAWIDKTFAMVWRGIAAEAIPVNGGVESVPASKEKSK